MSNFQKVLQILKESKTEKPVKKLKASAYDVTADLFKDDKGFYLKFKTDWHTITLPKHDGGRFKTEEEAQKGFDREMNDVAR